MRRFLFKCALLAAPFLMHASGLYWLDPYRFFPGASPRLDTLRKQTAGQFNSCLWTLATYDQARYRNILLGDSRMALLPAPTVSQTIGEPVFNLSYGAATLNEMIQTFWLAQDVVPLRRVWIGVSFNQYSDYNRTFRADDYLALRQNPLLYFTSRVVNKSAAYMVFYGLTGADPGIGKVTATPEEFWKETLGPLTARYYTRHTEPVLFKRDLQKLVDHCRRRNIELRFVIPPTHVELQRRVADFGLKDRYARFKQELAAMAETYDFDYPNPLTAERSNFLDPMHVHPRWAETLAHEIASGELTHGRRISGSR